MQLPVVFNNRYQLLKKIGEGGLAEVYQAQDMALGRMVAVKALRSQYTQDPTFLVNFHKEAQSVAKLSDPFIVSVYDFGQDHNRPYIVFEWIAGADMRTRLDEKTVFSLDQAVEYTIQICTAVGTAHRNNLVHGDLKPGNILMTLNNQARVTDFGLARALGASAMDDGEVVWGTPAYFAPEQAAGDRVLPATDVYAIGIIMYEMLTGRLPFSGADDQEIARKQLYEAHVPVDQINPNIPEPLARIIDAAMAKNVNERFLTADHLREALNAFKRGGYGRPTYQQQSPISAVVGSPLQQRGQAQRPYVSASQAATKQGRGFDIILLILGLLAILAVLGLVPLFFALYNAYSQAPTDDARPILSGFARPNMAQMPDLVGLSQAEAEQAMVAQGAVLFVRGEEPHDSPAGTVIDQGLAAGEPVQVNEQVSIIISTGPAMVELPSVLGMQYEDAEVLLTSLNLVPHKTEEWSAEPTGQVLRQEVAEGTTLDQRTLIPLVVSSGSRTPNFAGEVTLAAYEIPRIQYRSGESISLTFFWQSTTQILENYRIFVYLTTPQGGIVSQIDDFTEQVVPPTTSWEQGKLIVGPTKLPVPGTTAGGEYQIRVAMTQADSDVRLPIADQGQASQDNLGALILHSVEVVP